MATDPLETFTPQVRDWFLRAFSGPTEAQAPAWPAIARGGNVLLSAPTGSGKTLAAFPLGLGRPLGGAARRVPVGARPPRRGADRRRREAHAPGLRVAAEGALIRHRAQPARAAA